MSGGRSSPGYSGRRPNDDVLRLERKSFRSDPRAESPHDLEGGPGLRGRGSAESSICVHDNQYYPDNVASVVGNYVLRLSSPLFASMPSSATR